MYAARLPEGWDWLVKARDNDAREILGRLDREALKALAATVKGAWCDLRH